MVLQDQNSSDIVLEVLKMVFEILFFLWVNNVDSHKGEVFPPFTPTLIIPMAWIEIEMDLDLAAKDLISDTHWSKL